MSFENLKSIFTEAAAKASPEARAAFLDEACAGDPSLRTQVESLLAAQNELGDFIEPAASRKSTESLDAAGTRIGPYTLLENIGEGGFGVVYMAEQERPVRRKVALKVIKAGMDTKQVIARFEVERQALALMDHPNIARVLDAGETPDGRPFFVMELVRGRPITEFCEEREVPVRERLKLLIQVAHAVQHAHQKGIIHRDLKPSNVMITLIDGAPVPKVIDFGVAKAIEQRLTGKTLFTRYDQMIGTPAYMSPEQAELSGQDVDTRSDIYALGCLLYELLTGTAPIEKETLRKAGFDEIRRLIRETDPPTPSTRVRQLTQTKPVSAQSPAPRPSPFSTDLDWIVMKCLEKERARRYATASELTADLQGFLNDEPVAARPPSEFYRLRKFVRRHRMRVIFLTGLSVAIVGGSILALVGFAHARQERDRALEAERHANEQRRIARSEAARSEQVSLFLKRMLQGVSPLAARGRDTAMLREILDQAVLRLEDELADQPEVEADLRTTIGLVYHVIGEYTNAVAMYSRALALRKAVYGEVHKKVARSLQQLGEVLQILGRNVESEALLREVVTRQRHAFSEDHPFVLDSLRRLGDVQRKLGGEYAVESKRTFAEAEAAYRKLLADLRSSASADPVEIANALEGLGSTLFWVPGRMAEVEALRRETLAILRQSLGEEHRRFAEAVGKLYGALYAQGKYAEAEPVIRHALALERKMHGSQASLASTSMLTQLGRMLGRMGRFAEAEEVLRESAIARRKLEGNGGLDLAYVLQHLGCVLNEQGKLAQAETTLGEALAIYEKVNPADWETFQTQSLLGDTLRKQGSYAAAEPLLLSAYTGLAAQDLDPFESEKRLQRRETVHRLVQLYEETGDPAQASEWKRKLAALDQNGR